MTTMMGIDDEFGFEKVIEFQYLGDMLSVKRRRKSIKISGGLTLL